MRRTYLLGTAVLIGFGLMAVTLLSDFTPRALWDAFTPHDAAQTEHAFVHAQMPAGTDALRLAALADDDPAVAKAAVYALAEVLTDGELGVLAEIARTAGQMSVRKAAVYALGDRAAAVPLLKVLATDGGHVEVRKAAVHALGNVGTPAARDALIALLQPADGPTL